MLKVKLEKPRAAKDDPEALRKWERSVPVAMAAALAQTLKERVQERGEPVRGYTPSNPKGVLVSPRYPGAEAGTLTSSGARRFRDKSAARAAFGDTPGHFSPSGGMWGGESVVQQGSRASEILFRGRSEGQDPAFFTYKSGKRRARGRSISNALKAWTVLEKTGINILELQDGELAAVEQALTDTMARATVAALGMNASLSSQPSAHPAYRLLRRLLAEGVVGLGS